MISLPAVLELKYPGINLLEDVVLRDVGDGPFIAEWKREDEKPTDEQIAEWVNDEELEAALNAEQTNSLIYKQLDEIDLKSIRALRTSDTVRLQELELQASKLRATLIK